MAKHLQIGAPAAGGLCLAMTSPASAAAHFLARSWQSEDGLPSNVVHAVAQAAPKGALEIIEAEIYEPLTTSLR